MVNKFSPTPQKNKPNTPPNRHSKPARLTICHICLGHFTATPPESILPRALETLPHSTLISCLQTIQGTWLSAVIVLLFFIWVSFESLVCICYVVYDSCLLISLWICTPMNTFSQDLSPVNYIIIPSWWAIQTNSKNQARIPAQNLNVQ